MTVVTGQRRTDNQATVQRYIDIAPEIKRLEPEATPLTTFMGRLAERTGPKLAGDPEFHWVESEREARYDAIDKVGGQEAGDTEWTVDSAEVFAQGQLVKVPRTGEIVYVKAIKGPKTIEVTRGFAGTSSAKLNNDEPLLIIGYVAEEGSRSPEARTKNPEKVTNYTEIFKTSIEISGTAESSKNQTSPHDWVYQHQEKMREHRIDMELAALFGSKGEATGPGGGKIRTTGGALYFCTQNNFDAGGTLTESELESWVRAICRHGTRKTVFCSPLVLSVINNFAVGRLQVIQADMDKTYGVAITKYMCAHGELNLVKHNLLEGATYGGYAIAIDFEKDPPKFRPLGGGPGGSRDTKVLKDRQDSDRDGKKDEILTEGGFEFPLVKRHGVLTGVTG